MTVEFGFGLLTCERYPGDLRTGVELYRLGLDLAAEAERLRCRGRGGMGEPGRRCRRVAGVVEVGRGWGEGRPERPSR